MDDRRVKQCACVQVTFREMKEAGVTSLADAARRFGAGLNCGLCVPYIKKMLETGETEFEVIPPD